MNPRRVSFIISLVIACLLTDSALADERIRSERGVKAFSSIVLSGVGNLTLTQGQDIQVIVEAPADIIDRVETRSEGGVLYLGFKPTSGSDLWDNRQPVQYFVQVEKLKSLETSGTGNVSGTALNLSRFDLSVRGTASVTLADIEAKSVAVRLSGTGSCTLTGTAKKQQVILSGTGAYNAEKFKTDDTVIAVNGLGSAVVWAFDTLDATINGMGQIKYIGEPKMTKRVSGLGRVIKAD